MPEIQKMTGFQSPCSEYAEDELSLDRLFIIDPPAMIFIRAGKDYPLFHIHKNDLLLIQRGRTPTHGALVLAVIDHTFLLARYHKQGPKHLLTPFQREVGNPEKGEDFIFGVVHSLHRKIIL